MKQGRKEEQQSGRTTKPHIELHTDQGETGRVFVTRSNRFAWKVCTPACMMIGVNAQVTSQGRVLVLEFDTNTGNVCKFHLNWWMTGSSTSLHDRQWMSNARATKRTLPHRSQTLVYLISDNIARPSSRPSSLVDVFKGSRSHAGLNVCLPQQRFIRNICCA